MPNKDKLYVNRYKTLKEHRAAVKARKLLKDGKNKGPVANNDAYGETIKKPKPTPARSTSSSSSSSSRPSTASRPSTPSTPSRPSTPSTPSTSSTSRSSSSSRSGTSGRNMPSNPPINYRGARTRGELNIANEVARNSGNRPPRRAPKEGDTKRTGLGAKMVYRNGKWRQVSKSK